MNACMYTLAMDAFDPKSELIQLLGTTPTHPWAALIPQILLWCFRRFCVQKLVLFEGKIEESLCEDALDLVHAYCPRGLEMVSIEWFTPENIEQVASSLEDYTAFMARFARHLDASIAANDYDAQDKISEFLDGMIAQIVSQWLDRRHASFFIFPTETESDDEFTETQFSKLINALLLYSYASKKGGAEIVQEDRSSIEKSEVQEPQDSLPEISQHPQPPLAVEQEQPPAWTEATQQPLSLLWHLIPIPKAEEPPVPKTTISEVMHRRRTLCVKGRRAQEPRVKTRKTHPAVTTKRE